MSTAVQPAPPIAEPAAHPKASPRLRVDFLDGMRGLAAVYVMLTHVSLFSTMDNAVPSAALSHRFLLATQWMNYGHYAVAVFIVLSGFCLMLPVARAHDRNLPGGLAGFAKRRARRILPPYYVALALFIALQLLSHHFMRHGAQGPLETTPGDIITHLLLIHNLFDLYKYGLDGPMWSVAWEWQIYFLFALLLLPLWRRFGSLPTICVAFAIGYLPHLLLPARSNLDWTCPWYLCLFAMGIGAAAAVNAPDGKAGMLTRAPAQNALLSVLAAGLLGAGVLHAAWTQNQNNFWLVDPFVGALAALFILSCAGGKNNAPLLKSAVRCLESRPAMVLGAFSYSIYLIHLPILNKMDEVMRAHGCSHPLQFAALLLIGVPLCLGIGYIFHIFFERPFMPGHTKTERRAEIAAIVSPAP